MPQAHGMVSSSTRHLEALKSKHRKLSKEIENKQKRFVMDDHEIAQLKREKLFVKEQIEGIRKAS